MLVRDTHIPYNDKENIVCLEDGEVWPCLAVSFRRSMTKEFKVNQFKVVWHKDEKRMQPYTIYSSSGIVQFCSTLEDVIKYCSKRSGVRG